MRSEFKRFLPLAFAAVALAACTSERTPVAPTSTSIPPTPARPALPTPMLSTPTETVVNLEIAPTAVVSPHLYDHYFPLGLTSENPTLDLTQKVYSFPKIANTSDYPRVAFENSLAHPENGILVLALEQAYFLELEKTGGVNLTKFEFPRRWGFPSQVFEVDIETLTDQTTHNSAIYAQVSIPEVAVFNNSFGEKLGQVSTQTPHRTTIVWHNTKVDQIIFEK
ncbi:hypothetical protein HY025_02120 [Candidatus Daviesbacteria bacterium]|nr:hypothetical protein [Candidatus Daviesbacteria bacterium]